MGSNRIETLVNRDSSQAAAVPGAFVVGRLSGHFPGAASLRIRGCLTTAACEDRRDCAWRRAPAGNPAPGPQAVTASFAAAGLRLTNAMHHVQRTEEAREHRHGAVNTVRYRAAFFEALEHEDAGSQVNAISGERQRLGVAASTPLLRRSENRFGNISLI